MALVMMVAPTTTTRRLTRLLTEGSKMSRRHNYAGYTADFSGHFFSDLTSRPRQSKRWQN